MARLKACKVCGKVGVEWKDIDGVRRVAHEHKDGRIGYCVEED